MLMRFHRWCAIAASGCESAACSGSLAPGAPSIPSSVAVEVFQRLQLGRTAPSGPLADRAAGETEAKQWDPSDIDAGSDADLGVVLFTVDAITINRARTQCHEIALMFAELLALDWCVADYRCLRHTYVI